MEPIMGHTLEQSQPLIRCQSAPQDLGVSVIPVYPCYCYLSGGRLHAETGMDARQADTYDDIVTHCMAGEEGDNIKK